MAEVAVVEMRGGDEGEGGRPSLRSFFRTVFFFAPVDSVIGRSTGSGSSINKEREMAGYI